jgi:cell division protein FtsX
MLNSLMRENWKDMLFVFAVTAFTFAVNYYVLSYRAAQKPAAAIQERGK